MLELPNDFPHQPPEGYSYKVKPHKRNVVSIWLQHPDHYTYSSYRVSTIWGFWSSKTGEYYAPINAKKAGDVVDINDTRNYTAMQIKYQGLEGFFI